MANSWKGSCHCGAIRFVFESDHVAADLPLRSCTCSFCIKRGTRCTSDASGKARFKIKKGALSNYDSASSLQRLLCKNCGIYVGSLLIAGSGKYVTLNVNTFENARDFAQTPSPVDYSNTTLAERKKRWQKVWTPALL